MLISMDLSFLMMSEKQSAKSRGGCYSICSYFQNVLNYVRQLSLSLFKKPFIPISYDYSIFVSHHLQHFFWKNYFQIKYSMKTPQNITEVVFFSPTFSQGANTMKPLLFRCSFFEQNLALGPSRSLSLYKYISSLHQFHHLFSSAYFSSVISYSSPHSTFQ